MLLAVTSVLLLCLAQRQVQGALDGQNQTSTNGTIEYDHLKPPPLSRLPTNLRPFLYDWTVKIYLPADDADTMIEESKKFTFEGELSIQIQCLEDTYVVVLHQNGLTIDRESISMKTMFEEEFALVDMVENDNKYGQDMVSFKFNRTLQTYEAYTLSLKYTGRINLSGWSAGIFRSYYYGGPNNTLRTVPSFYSYLIATQMEYTDARRALPCFDEPHFKSAFRVTIIHPKSTKALSNGMELTEQPFGTHWQKTTFKDSPIMSSYLLAIAVFYEEYADYGYQSADPMKVPQSVQHIRFRVYASNSDMYRAKYALEIGPKLMAFFQEHLNMTYTPDKCDMISVPGFSYGGMENWGLIVYQPSSLLYHANVNSLFDKQRVARVVAHELAHMWFGNVVTMEWWDNLWLNEGFATFMELESLSEIEPEFKMAQVFVKNDMQRSMGFDQTTSSHPLNVNIESDYDIQYKNRAQITYKKGGSYLRMIQHVVNKNDNGTFERALQKYLQSYKYGNANHTDLLRVIANVENQFNEDLYNMMLSWVVQMGFPLVTVKRKDENTVELSQERFLINARSEDADKYAKYQWYVPVFYYGLNDAGMYNGYLTLTPNVSFTITGAPQNKWILVNTDAIGYYRVLYEKENYDLLAEALKNNISQFSVETRCQLLDDARDLGNSGRLPYGTALKMTEFLKSEQNPRVWNVAIRHLNEVLTHLKNTSIHESFELYMKDLLQNQYDAVTAENYQATGLLDETLQVLIKNAMCSLEQSDCNGEIIPMFDDEPWFEKESYDEKNVGDQSQNIPHNHFLASTFGQFGILNNNGLAAAEPIDSNEKWLEKHYDEVANWLKNRNI